MKCKPLHTCISNDVTYPALWVLVWMVLLRQSEVSFPDFTLLVPEDIDPIMYSVLLSESTLSNYNIHTNCPHVYLGTK